NIFMPDREISRSEFLKIVMKSSGTPIPESIEPGDLPFADVSPDDWFGIYVKSAYELGIIQGYDDEGGIRFRPDANISRAEAMKILIKAFKIDTSSTVDARFLDVPADAWFAEYINYAAQKGIVSGYTNGNFGPQNNLTRGQAAKIVTLISN
ncbi:S-layer homology domain-containing protein, partial [Patescibacteria group bacterium]|nr:S-layer homology domain-containing protein [Patescibacteria group bacterium]